MKTIHGNGPADWDKARRILHDVIMRCAALGVPGLVSLHHVVMPLKRRYDRGERTEDLYREILDLQ